MKDIKRAIQELVPNAKYAMRGSGTESQKFASIVWQDATTMPTWNELLQKDTELSLKEDLYAAAAAYQGEAGCDANFFSLLMIIKASGTIGTLAQECLDWLDTLWADYFTRKAAIPTEPSLDFSSHGSIPHTFTEVRDEAEPA